MAKRRLPEPVTKVTLTLPDDVVSRLDDFADEFEDYISRSELVAEILGHVLDDDDLLDEIFPEED